MKDLGDTCRKTGRKFLMWIVFWLCICASLCSTAAAGELKLSNPYITKQASPTSAKLDENWLNLESKKYDDQKTISPHINLPALRITDSLRVSVGGGHGILAGINLDLEF